MPKDFLEINQNFFKKGIDFIEKLRYNVGLYEHLQNRRCNDAQH